MFRKCAVRVSMLYTLLLSVPSCENVIQFKNITGDEIDMLTREKHSSLSEFKRFVQHGVANDRVENSPSTSRSHTKYEDNDEDNGGPSSEFRPKGHDWKSENRKQNKKAYSRSNFLNNSSQINLNEINEFYTHLPDVMKDLEKDLDKTLQKAKLKGIVTGKYRCASK